VGALSGRIYPLNPWRTPNPTQRQRPGPGSSVDIFPADVDRPVGPFFSCLFVAALPKIGRGSSALSRRLRMGGRQTAWAFGSSIRTRTGTYLMVSTTSTIAGRDWRRAQHNYRRTLAAAH